MKVSVLSLVFLPLTFGYAIFRYRLMDVDLIFKRGMAYTIAAGAITAAYFARSRRRLRAVPPELPQRWAYRTGHCDCGHRPAVRPVQELGAGLSRQVLLQKRYDYRKTLIEFGRDLNSETDLDQMLTSIVDRLSRTLMVDRMAIFLSNPEQPEQFMLAKSYGISQYQRARSRLPARGAAGVGGGPPVLRQHQPGRARNARARRKPFAAWT